MWQRDIIPGFAEAQDSERVDRSIAFIGLTELIAGVKCAPLTPFRVELLRAYGNPFIVGGIVSIESILQFLWMVNADFKLGSDYTDAFIEKHAGLDIESARNGIDEYLDRAYLDAPSGSTEKPFFAPAAGMVVAMSDEPFRWTMERTLATPLAVLYQLIKCRDKSQLATVINRRSDKVASDWLDTMHVITETSIDLVKGRIDEMRKDGWEIASNISPNCEHVEVGGIVTVNTNNVKSWSAAMRKGIPHGK